MQRTLAQRGPAGVAATTSRSPVRSPVRSLAHHACLGHGRPKYARVGRIAATEEPRPATEKSEAEEATVKYGLEAGLWKVFTSKDGSDTVSKGKQAKDLLKRYGSAYLLTSVSFAIVSFAACYALVNAGVDVAGLLGKVGLTVSDTGERVGTFAIAYAAHKALSPVRFGPTVALTPVVARWLGKDLDKDAEDMA